MSPHTIFYPMAALVALTMAAVTAVALLRFRAVGRGEVSEDFYQLFRGEGRPDLEAKLSRHYQNLLELPILFYVVGLAIFAAGIEDRTFVNLLWLFVAIRIVHMAVHVSYNRPAHRAAAFALGLFVLIAVWIRFLMLVGGGGAAA